MGIQLLFVSFDDAVGIIGDYNVTLMYGQSRREVCYIVSLFI